MFYVILNAALAVMNAAIAMHSGSIFQWWICGFCAGMSLAFFAEWVKANNKPKDEQKQPEEDEQSSQQ